jgi:hypothetical protein
MDEDVRKKQKRSEAQPVVDGELHESLATLLRVLGTTALDSDGLQHTTPVPVALLKTIASKVLEQRFLTGELYLMHANTL